MALAHNTSIETRGLVLHLDPANRRSYNPNLVTTQGSFNYSFSGQTLPTELDFAPDGSYVLCRHNLTGANGPFMNARVFTSIPVGTYTISAWVKGTTAFSGAFAYIGETPGSSGAASATINVTTAWQRVSHTLSITTAQTNGRVQIFFGTQGNNLIISVFGVQMVRGSQPLDYYPNIGNNGNSLFDLSGNGRNGTLINSTGFSSQFGGVMDFTRPTGNQSWVSIPHDAAISSQVFGNSTLFTLSAWVYVRGFYDYGTLIQKAQAGSYSNTTCGLWVESPSQRNLRLVIGSNVGGNPAGSTTSVIYSGADVNTWYHMVGVGNGSTAALYINGDFFAQTNFSNITVTRTENNNPIVIGTRSNINTPELDALVGPISVYNRSLSAAEVRKNFEATRRRFGL